MNRKLLKDNAKIALKRNFWLIMLVVFVAQFFGVTDVGSGGGSSGNFSGSSSESSGGLEEFFEEFEDSLEDEKGSDYGYTMETQEGGMQRMSFDSDSFGGYGASAALAGLSVAIVFLIAGGIIVVAVLWSTFLVNPIAVGYRRFFMLNRSGQGKFSDLFSSFCPKYVNIVKGMFTTNLIIFGWSLLLIIPGIIKSYQYFFVPFILCENPGMSGTRAREISKSMTDGHKFHIFVLGLSFFGWILLGTVIAVPATLLTCCLLGIGGTIAFTPLAGYMAATYAELYEERREYVLCNHMVSAEELCGFSVEVQS